MLETRLVSSHGRIAAYARVRGSAEPGYATKNVMDESAKSIHEFRCLLDLRIAFAVVRPVGTKDISRGCANAKRSATPGTAIPLCVCAPEGRRTQPSHSEKMIANLILRIGIEHPQVI